ncbi:MAG TPA: hypothetical protein PLC32_01235 [Candidatus Omnitrophota bacterium]|nr:hypothetical protein [Candidatus Omnitrophota bacterium]
MKEDFFSKIEEIVEKDPRYKEEAYEFVMRSLSFTQKRFRRQGHITGQELLEGIKDYAFEEFGTMAKSVLEHWGITKTEDFGHIVFNMVNNGLLKKTDEDSVEDFKNIYDFNDVFEHGYRQRFEEEIKKHLKDKE